LQRNDLILREVPTIDTIVERLDRFLQLTVGKPQIPGEFAWIVPAKALRNQARGG